MWMAILRVMGGPVIKGLIDAYNLHLKAQSADAATAANLAAQEIAAQTAETNALTQLKVAEIGHPWEPGCIGANSSGKHNPPGASPSEFEHLPTDPDSGVPCELL